MKMASRKRVTVVTCSSHLREVFAAISVSTHIVHLLLKNCRWWRFTLPSPIWTCTTHTWANTRLTAQSRSRSTTSAYIPNV